MPKIGDHCLVMCSTLSRQCMATLPALITDPLYIPPPPVAGENLPQINQIQRRHFHEQHSHTPSSDSQFHMTIPIRMLQRIAKPGSSPPISACAWSAAGEPAVGWISPSSKKNGESCSVQQPNRTVMLHVIDCIGLEEIIRREQSRQSILFKRWLEREVVPPSNGARTTRMQQPGDDICPPGAGQHSRHEASPETAATHA